MVEEDSENRTGLFGKIVETAEIIVQVASHMMVPDEDNVSLSKEKVSEEHGSGSIKSNFDNEDLKGQDLFRILRDEATEALDAMKEDMRNGKEVPAATQLDAAIRDQMVKEQPTHMTGAKFASNKTFLFTRALRAENMEAEKKPAVVKVDYHQENVHEKHALIIKIRDTAHNFVLLAKNLVHGKKNGKQDSNEPHTNENTEADSKKDENRLEEMREDAAETMEGMKEDVSHDTNVPIVNEMDAAIRGSMINEDPYNTQQNQPVKQIHPGEVPNLHATH